MKRSSNQGIILIMAFFVMILSYSVFGAQKSLSIYDKQLISAQKLLSKSGTRKEGFKQLKAIASYAKSKKNTDKFKAGCDALVILARIKREAWGYEFIPPKKSFEGIGETSDKDRKKKAIKDFEDKLEPFGEYSIINDWQYDKKDKYSNPQILPFIEFAYYKALNKEEMDNMKEALKMLTYAESRTEGIDKAEILCQWGELLRELKEYKRSQAYLKKALAYGKDWFKSEKVDYGERTITPPGTDRWRKVKARIDDLLVLLQFDLLGVDYEEAYADYVKMRNYYEKQDWYHAYPLTVKLKTEYPETVYGDVGRLYWCRILLKNEIAGEDRDKTLPSGVKEMEKFVEDNPYGLYRGEALMDLGKHFLENKWDADKSSVYYKKALDWFQKVRAQKNAIDLFALSEKVKKIAAPKENIFSLNKNYQIEYRKPDVKEIINRNTAPWYITEKEKNCLFMVGFFDFYNGKYEQARKSFHEVGTFDKILKELESKNIPNALWRLDAACNIKYMVFPQHERNSINGKNRLKVAYAELKYLLENFDYAKSVFQGLYLDKENKDNARALGALGMALCMDRSKKAEDLLKEASALGGKSPIAGNALIRLGKYYQGDRRIKDDSAYSSFKKYLKSFPNGTYARDAHFRLGVIYLEKENLSQAENHLKHLKPTGNKTSGYYDYLSKKISEFKKRNK
jgi:hypothetical protein